MAAPTAIESQALLAHAEDEAWWFRAKEDIVRSFLAPYLAEESRIAVLGVGNGATVARLRERAPGCRILGIDVDEAAVRLCASRDPQGRYRVADLDKDPIAEAETVDVAIALDLLEHMEDDEAVVGRVVDALAPGGLFVVNVPAHPWLHSSHDVHLGHRRRYRPRELRRLLEGAGLAIVHATPLFSSTLVGVVLWRRIIQPLLGWRADRSDVSARLPGPLDRILYGISRLEGWVAKLGLPFGSSQLAIGRKPFKGKSRT